MTPIEVSRPTLQTEEALDPTPIPPTPAPIISATDTPLPSPTPVTQYTLLSAPEPELDLPKVEPTADLGLPLEIDIFPREEKVIEGPFPCVWIKFNREIDQELIVRAIEVEPSFAFELDYTRHKKWICIQSLDPWQFQSDYTITLNPTVLAPDDQTLPEPLVRSYRIADPNWLMFANWSNESGKWLDIELKPVGQIELANIDASFLEISPAIENLEWMVEGGGWKLSDASSRLLKEEVEYSLRMNKAPIDRYGRQLPLPSGLTFTVPSANYEKDDYLFASIVGQGPPFETVAANGRRAVPLLEVSHTDAFNFKLYPITPEEFIRSVPTRRSQRFNEPVIDGVPNPPEEAAYAWVSPLPQNRNPIDVSVEAIIPEEVPSGLYILEEERGALTVLLTNYFINAKAYRGGVTVWVTDSQGVPAPNGSVTLYSQSGAIIGEAELNEIGVGHLSNDDPNRSPFMVVARVGDEITLTGLSRHWDSAFFCGVDNRWQAEEAHGLGYDLHAQTDQPIYRPGDTVHFHGLVRQRDGATFTRLESEAELSILLKNGDAVSAGNAILRSTVTTAGNGHFSGELELPDELRSPDKDYVLQFVLDDAVTTLPLKINDYLSPHNLKISVTPHQPFYQSREEVIFQIEVTAADGSPFASQPITITESSLERAFDNRTVNPTHVWEASWSDETYLTLDAGGLVTYTLPFFSRDIGIEIETGDTAHFLTLAEYERGSGRITLDYDLATFTPNQPLTFTLQTLDLLDQPIGNQPVSLTLSERIHPNESNDRVLETFEVTSDENGLAAITLPGYPVGTYKIELRNLNLGGYLERTIHIADGDRDKEKLLVSNLRLWAEDDAYQPGDTAVVWIESTFSGPALLTVERDRVLREQLVSLTFPYTRVELSILPGDGPNLFVSVSALRPNLLESDPSGNTGMAEPAFYTAVTEIGLPQLDKIIDIELIPLENQADAYLLRTVDAQGAPVVAEITAAMVDPRVFALVEEPLISSVGQLYQPDERRLRNFATSQPYRLVGLLSDTRCSGGEFRTEHLTAFYDPLLWMPGLQTDANGEVMLVLPGTDLEAEWRLTLTAISDDLRVGESTFYLQSGRE